MTNHDDERLAEGEGCHHGQQQLSAKGKELESKSRGTNCDREVISYLSVPQQKDETSLANKWSTTGSFRGLIEYNLWFERNMRHILGWALSWHIMGLKRGWMGEHFLLSVTVNSDLIF